jgi:hypothetical protein
MIFKITTLHAFISEDENGEEGVVSAQMQMPNGLTWVPMIMADEKRIQSLRPIAEKAARTQKKKIKLVRFSVREDLETL